jgi:hypothetical protein
MFLLKWIKMQQGKDQLQPQSGSKHHKKKHRGNPTNANRTNENTAHVVIDMQPSPSHSTLRNEETNETSTSNEPPLSPATDLTSDDGPLPFHSKPGLSEDERVRYVTQITQAIYGNDTGERPTVSAPLVYGHLLQTTPVGYWQDCLQHIADMEHLNDQLDERVKAREKERHLTTITQAIYGIVTNEPTIISAQRIYATCETSGIPIAYRSDCILRIRDMESVNRQAAEETQRTEQMKKLRKESKYLAGWAVIIASFLVALATALPVLYAYLTK